jgi:DNA repair protein SbcC/Rad50
MLKQVVVRNWRAFDTAEVALRPGLNVLLGPNGAGKTSLLEAIAYALAGEPSTLSDVRLMARAEGPVDVAVALDLDGTAWEIRRGLGPTHRRGAESLRRAGTTTAEGGEQVAAALERLLGVPGDFFLRILYMPEGDVYRFVADPPLAALDAHLRRVLGLEQLALLDRAAAQVKREISYDRNNLITLAEQAASRAGLLAEGRSRWSGDLAERRRALEAERDRLAAELSTAGQRRRAAEDAVNRTTRAISDLAAIEREQAELLANGDPAAALPALRARCAQLGALIQKLDGTMAEITAEQKLLADQRRLLAARSAADLAAADPQRAARYQELVASISELDGALAAVVAERKALAQRGQSLQARAPADLVADDPVLRERRDERERAIRRLDDSLAAAASERKTLAESTQFLEAHAPGAGVDPVCPVCRQPLPEALRQRLLAENAGRDADLEAQIATLRAERERQVEEARAEAEALKQRLLAEHAAAATTLAEREATLRGQRKALEETLQAETEAARQHLLAEHNARAREGADRLVALRAERENTRTTLEETEKQDGQARDRRRRLDDLAARRQALLPSDATPDTLRDERARLHSEAATARDQEALLAGQLDEVREELATLQGYLQLAAMEGHSPGAIAAKHAAIARRELLAELFATATADTLRRLREGALSEAYGEVERAWGAFSGWTDAQIKPLAKGRLAVQQDGRSLDLAQLSGGERAAFLALLHAHLGRHFGRGGFLVLDEPLEHLDADNGRRLLEHLRRACAEGLLTQVVLATVEADVVRTTIGAGEAHVIELPLRPAART